MITLVLQGLLNLQLSRHFFYVASLFFFFSLPFVSTASMMAARTRLDASSGTPVRCLTAHTLGASALLPIKSDAVTFYFHEAYGVPKVIVSR